jgi:hypothetical protein
MASVEFIDLTGGCSGRRVLTGCAVIAGTLLLTVTTTWATPTTVGLVTAGTLTVNRADSLTAQLPEGLPSNGFYDVYHGTYTASVMNFPTLPITQPYASTLTGSVSVGDSTYSYDETSLPTVSASTANELAMEAEALAESPSGAFFPDFLPNTYYAYSQGNITIASRTDLAMVFPDTGPFSALYTNGTYAVSTPGLTLVATPVPTPTPEPASAALLGSALFGLGLLRRKHRRVRPRWLERSRLGFSDPRRCVPAATSMVARASEFLTPRRIGATALTD